MWDDMWDDMGDDMGDRTHHSGHSPDSVSRVQALIPVLLPQLRPRGDMKKKNGPGEKTSRTSDQLRWSFSKVKSSRCGSSRAADDFSSEILIQLSLQLEHTPCGCVHGGAAARVQTASAYVRANFEAADESSLVQQ
ncbi:unnamed protein product [Pleuronectes platessa]|uniref:Uncharacterized protein n=1 Tax=Pleuronectes platessa TaxID=8262 RepID=A0A9N7VVB4_PLEPL|nr:unnamed protein product [Pleuronectes platessa]